MIYSFNIDGMLLEYTEFIMKYAPKYMYKKYGISTIDNSKYSLEEIFGLENYIKGKNPNILPAKLALELKKIKNDFWIKHYTQYITMPFKSDVVETINHLYETGNDIYIFSNDSKVKEYISDKAVREIIKYKLKSSGLKYHKFIQFENSNDMIEGIKNRRISIVAENDPELISKISQFTDVIGYDLFNINNYGENVVLVNKKDKKGFQIGISKLIEYNNMPLKPNSEVPTNEPSKDKLWLKYYKRRDVKYVLERKHPLGRIKDMHIDYPEGTLFSYSRTNKKLKTNDFFKKAAACEAWLRNQGIGKGDYFPMLTLNTFEAVIMAYALMKIKATIVPISPTETANSIVNKIKDLNPKPKMMYIVDHFNPKTNKHFVNTVEDIMGKTGINNVVYSKLDFFSLTLSPKERLGMIRNVLTNKTMFNSMINYKYNDSFISIDTLLKEKINNIQIDDQNDNDLDYPAALIYTSGSEKSKGVVLTPRNIDTELVQYYNSILNLKRGEKISCFLPFDHVFGLIIGILVTLTTGMEGVMISNFDRDKVADLLIYDDVDYLSLLPILLNGIINSKDLAKKEKIKLKKVFSGSQVISETLMNQTQEFFDSKDSSAKIVNGYGSSELTCVFLIDGVPILMGDAKVVKIGTTEELGYNEIGEFCVSGDAVFKEYYNMLELTNMVCKTHDDGKLWYHTGDLASVDFNGRFNYQGRVKNDFIKVNGHQVYLYKIKRIIESNKNVKECLVIDIPDIMKGNVPVVFVMPTSVDVDIQQLVAEIKNMCNANLEYYEFPSEIFVVNNFPLTSRGKVDTKYVSEKYEELIENKLPDIVKVLNSNNKTKIR